MSASSSRNYHCARWSELRDAGVVSRPSLIGIPDVEFVQASKAIGMAARHSEARGRDLHEPLIEADAVGRSRRGVSLVNDYITDLRDGAHVPVFPQVTDGRGGRKVWWRGLISEAGQRLAAGVLRRCSKRYTWLFGRLVRRRLAILNISRRSPLISPAGVLFASSHAWSACQSVALLKSPVCHP